MKFALIGEKLSHSFSKSIHEAFGKYSYDLVSVSKDNLASFVANCEYDGFNVTIPYKKDIMKFCTCISPSAKEIGCVNTVLKKDGKLYGYNTDFDGFSALSKRSGIGFDGKRVAVLGSGGTSLTVSAVAKSQNAKKINIISRSGIFNYENTAKWNDCEIIINTTPVGMFPNSGASPVNISDFPLCTGVLDVIYNPLCTKLVFDARQKNIPASNGLYMLVYQAKRAFEIFTGESLSDEKTEEIFQNLLKKMTNIVLIGMPGCGKTTLGQTLAKETCRELIDTDEEIVKKTNMSIPEIFEKYGEDYFRSLETSVTREFGSLSVKIIATGGGIVTRDENFYPLKQNGILCYIQSDPENLATENRPLSKDLDSLKKMEKVRRPLYKKFADRVIDLDVSAKDIL